MDPLTALGLASNVVQLVDFAIRIATKSRQIYKDGATIEQRTFMEDAQHLQNLSESLQKSLQPTAQITLSGSDKELHSLAVKCQYKAIELHVEILKLSTTATGSLRLALSKTFKSSFRSGKISQIRNELFEIQKLLDSKLLGSLHEKAKYIAFEQKKSYEKLDSRLQFFITKLANGFDKTEELIKKDGSYTRDHVSVRHKETQEHDTAEHITTRAQLASGFQSLRMEEASFKRREAFIQSLIFPEINFRQEQIADAHRDTFEWIFDESGQRLRPWPNFVDWLKDTENLYWLIGKAGSGKSTLMNFICNDSRTAEYLLKGQANAKSNPLIATFFFWNAGNPMQKTVRGLLQSLIYQLLAAEQDLYDKILDNDPSLRNRHLGLVWSPKLLKILLVTAIRALSRPLCIFLDGLDEFDEKEEYLLDIVRDLRGLPGVKFCVSSRPSESCNASFGECPRLKMEQLTRDSLDIYLRGTVLESLTKQKLPDATEDQSSKLIKSILDKADGIFLWVEIVAKQILQGVTGRDSWEYLLKRVDSLPKEIESIYQRMWDRYEGDLKIYAEDSRFYFRLILVKELPLLQFMIAVNMDLQQKYLQDGAVIDTTEIANRCQDVQVHIATRCAGLLEVSSVDPEHHDSTAPFGYQTSHDLDQTSITGMYVQLRVQLIHRTARDFVRARLSHDENDEEVYRALVRSRCATWRLDPNAKKSLRMHNELNYVNDISSKVGHFMRSDLWDTVENLSNWVSSFCEMQDIRQIFAWIPSIAVDFLGSVAEHGYTEVVADYLSRRKLSDPSYLTYILSCTLLECLFVPRNFTDRCYSICEILRAGANPMIAPIWAYTKYRREWARITPWHLFLFTLRLSYWRFAVAQPALKEVLSMFLAREVDLEQTIPLVFSLQKYSFTDFWNEVHTRSDLIVVQTNTKTILRCTLGDQDWYSSVEATMGTLGPVDLYEAILIYDRRRRWYRVSSPNVSIRIVERIEKLSLAQEEQLQLRKGPFYSEDLNLRIEDVLRGEIPDSYPAELANLFREVAKEANTNNLVNVDSIVETMKIPGWTGQTTIEMLRLLSFGDMSDEKVVKDYKMPRTLLEALGAEINLIKSTPDHWLHDPEEKESHSDVPSFKTELGEEDSDIAGFEGQTRESQMPI